VTCWFLIARAVPKASRRHHQHTAEVTVVLSAKCKGLMAVIEDILQSTDGMEFSTNIAGTGESCQNLNCNAPDLMTFVVLVLCL